MTQPKESGVNKFVLVTFPKFFLIGQLARQLENLFAIKVNFRIGTTYALEFLWIPELSAGEVEIILDRLKKDHSGTVEFKDESSFPLFSQFRSQD